MKKLIRWKVDLGQGHLAVSTSVKAANHVLPFKHPQRLIEWDYSMQTMSPKDGNASADLLSLTLDFDSAIYCIPFLVSW